VQAERTSKSLLSVSPIHDQFAFHASYTLHVKSAEIALSGFDRSHIRFIISVLHFVRVSAPMLLRDMFGLLKAGI
jgi:hypothetical protein